MSHFYDAAGWTGFRLKIKDGPHIVPVFRHSLHGLLFPLWAPVYFLTRSSWHHGCSSRSGCIAGGGGQMARDALLGALQKRVQVTGLLPCHQSSQT